MRHLHSATLLCVALFLAGCADIMTRASDADTHISKDTQAPFSKETDMTPGEAALAKGIMAYDEASYPLAESYFKNALELHLVSVSSQIKAYKYLAFIHCTSSRKNLCRSEFRKMLELDPGYNLEPTEEGHPLWGPVFQGVKAETASAPGKK